MEKFGSLNSCLVIVSAVCSLWRRYQQKVLNNPQSGDPLGDVWRPREKSWHASNLVDDGVKSPKTAPNKEGTFVYGHQKGGRNLH